MDQLARPVTARNSMSGATNWQSAAVPPTIRRPWRVFEEDLEDKLADDTTDGAVVDLVRERLAAVQARGAHAAFLGLPEDLQRTYAEVSLMELSAYVCWRRSQASRAQGTDEDPSEFESAWDILDCDDKAEWVPEDPRAILAADTMWAPLLADGPPECGGVVGQGLVGPAEATTASPETGKAMETNADVNGKEDSRMGQCANTTSPSAPKEREEVDMSTTKDKMVNGSGGKDRGSGRGRGRGRGSAPNPAASMPSATPRSSSRPARACKKAAEQVFAGSPPPMSRKNGGSGRRRRVPSSGETDEELAARTGPNPLQASCANGSSRVGHTAAGRNIDLSNLCPEATDAACCVCGKDDATDENDLGLCDRCDRAFHARCHDPPVHFFGNLDDQWFCSKCTKELAELRGLGMSVGDFAWVSLAGSHPWPARVLRVDFASLADPKPYWVQFYETNGTTGSWVSETQILPWSEGPAFSKIKDSRRRLAVRLAEGDGAARISTAGPTAPLAPLPTVEPLPPSLTMGQRATKRVVRPQSTRGSGKEDTQKRHRQGDQDSPTEEQMTSQLEEMRALIAAAKERQQKLEEELDEASKGAVSGL